MLPLPQLTSPASTPKCTVPRRHQQYGFSLLELVVVMGILAIFASVSLTFVGEKDVQQRYNESLEKLTMVKRNFFSVDKFQGQMIMHGFFIDNGLINDGIRDDYIMMINGLKMIDDDNNIDDDGRIVKCQDAAANEEDSVEVIEAKKVECIYKVSVSTSLKIILDKEFQYDEYLPFSFVDSIPVNDAVIPSGDNNGNSVVTIGGKIIGAGLYKGIRPGAFDLSQYQDANNEIRDAWGDKFKLNSEFDTNTIQIGIENEDYKYLDKTENNSGPSKSKVDISYSDLVVNVDVNLTLEIGKQESIYPEFRFAVVSFDNNTKCREPDNSCWTTQLSDTLEPSSLPTTFALEETPLTSTSVSFNNTTDLIISIGPDNIDPDGDGEKITNLFFFSKDDDDDNNKKWSLTPQPLTASADFNGNLMVGSHVVVLLELDKSAEPAVWKIYDSDRTEDNVNHIFEYLHIFPGQTPNPITMSIP